MGAGIGCNVFGEILFCISFRSEMMVRFCSQTVSNLFSMLSPQWDDVSYEYNPVQGGQHHGEHHDEGGGVGGDRGEG